MSFDLGARLHELLSLDRSLGAADRKVLENLLLAPQPTTARDLSRTTRTNAQSVYTVLDRLEERGLVVEVGGARVRLFRAAHPSALLQELLDPWHRISGLASEVEEPLRRLYESGGANPAEATLDSSAVTAPFTASMSSLIEQVRSAQKEVWVVGSEDPWVARSRAIETELVARSRGPNNVRVRMLIRPPTEGTDGARVVRRMRRAGIDVRYTSAFSGASVILDRSYVFLRSGSKAIPAHGPALYTRLHAPELCGDLAAACEEEWKRSIRRIPVLTHGARAGPRPP